MSDKQTVYALKQRQQYLASIIHDAEKMILKAPPGTVEIKKHGHSVQFYHRNNSKEKHGTYIAAKNRKLVSSLAQKRYCRRLIGAAKKQQTAISAFLRSYNPDALENVFVAEGPVRQSLIRPVELPDVAFLDSWLSTEYQGKGFQEGMPVHFTAKEERVRSKSEVLIANALFRENIPYKYECPLLLGNQIYYPDFTILRLSDRKQLYWEHLGLIDDADYRNLALQKILKYEENGIFPGENLILSFESYKYPLNNQIIQRLIQHYILGIAA